MAFEWQQPGGLYPAPSATRAKISRRQLLFTPGGSEQVRVDRVGQRRPYHNGKQVEDCMARAGDTLRPEEVAVFVLEMRAPMAKVEHYPLVKRRFPFGQADAFGMVGESIGAWRLREQLAGVAPTPLHIMFTGESGSGKEVRARALHAMSDQARKSAIHVTTSTSMTSFSADVPFPTESLGSATKTSPLVPRIEYCQDEDVSVTRLKFGDLEFSWDPRKAKLNVRHHQVSFEEAVTVFFNPLARMYDDPDHSETEARFLLVGHSLRGRMLLVVHAEKGDTIRIISARRVTKTEAEGYESNA